MNLLKNIPKWLYLKRKLKGGKKLWLKKSVEDQRKKENETKTNKSKRLS